MVSVLYRLALRLYPPAFLLRYREEISRVFDEGLRDARAAGVGSTLRYYGKAVSDLLANAMRERFAAMNHPSAAAGFFAILAGGLASYVDFRASEVQATLLVLITSNFVLGCMAPNGTWRRALTIAALLPASHVAVYAFGKSISNQGHPYFSRVMMIFPALVASFLGAYAGVFLRFVTRELIKWFTHPDGPDPGALA